MLLPSAKEPSMKSVRLRLTGGTTVISIKTKAVVGHNGKKPSTIHGGRTAYAKYTSAGLVLSGGILSGIE